MPNLWKKLGVPHETKGKTMQNPQEMMMMADAMRQDSPQGMPQGQGVPPVPPVEELIAMVQQMDPQDPKRQQVIELIQMMQQGGGQGPQQGPPQGMPPQGMPPQGM